MLKNYFKIAIAVLKRRKFFTFISLFGISFSLTIIMVLTAFSDHLVDSSYPDAHRSRNLYISMMRLTGEKHGFSQNGPPSFYFLDHYVKKMKTPEKVAITSFHQPTNTYINNKKLTIDQKFTDDTFWEVLDFEFLEGKPYTRQQIDNAERVAVISENVRRKYFGDEPSVTGRYIETDNIRYRVSGVVKSVPITQFATYGDMYLPHTLGKRDPQDKGLNGDYFAILQGKDASSLPAMAAEYDDIIRRLPIDTSRYDKISSRADKYVASYTRLFIGNQDDSGLNRLLLYVGLVLLFFLLLPTLNLVNINTSRIMERSSEIAVRKAFGASSGTLALQFIVENLILTVIGGLIGVVLSFIVLAIWNNSGALEDVYLYLNYKVLIISLLVCLVFGLMSGVYPAWRMSRLHVVTALKTY
ncbi:ABC transporter permease [Chitinophaga sp. GCM10012297]|uniref:ABC transporter permease n=1 Tax=Chitinophaga chungangae TaxID=2821488 RepID=A0ABS3YHZ1_9BACT|nr:ABC transporter permease [Chitinophaga chungangae]MBO9154045.1 ABC transporter permease [Chitinophaga chungangae]